VIGLSSALARLLVCVAIPLIFFFIGALPVKTVLVDSGAETRADNLASRARRATDLAADGDDVDLLRRRAQPESRPDPAGAERNREVVKSLEPGDSRPS